MERWSAPEGRMGFSFWPQLLDPGHTLPGSYYGVSLQPCGVTGKERAASLVSFELQRSANIQGSLSPSHGIFQASSEGYASAQRQAVFRGHPTGKGVCPWEVITRDGPVLQEECCRAL